MNYPTLRHAARLNTLTAALHAALVHRLIRLNGQPFEDVVFDFEIANLPAIGGITDTGLGEITVHAIISPTEFGRHFACTLIGGHKRALFGEAVATGWFELRSGRFQEIGEYHGSDKITPLLARSARLMMRKHYNPVQSERGGRCTSFAMAQAAE